jgi:hypothetical protein
MTTGVATLASKSVVPGALTFNDNIGNSELLAPGGYFRGLDLSGSSRRRLYPGDVLLAEVEIDPSFDKTHYQVDWWLKTAPGGRGNSNLARVEITNMHIGERMELQFKLRTTNNWHRDSSGYDDVIDFIYRVLPPPS